MLFRSYLMVLAVYIVGGAVLRFGAQFILYLREHILPGRLLVWVAAAMGSLVWVFVVAAAGYLGLRFLVNCTNYRNHRVHMRSDSLKPYLTSTFKGALLTFFTLGLYYPWFSYELKKIKINAMSYGQHQFKLKLSSGEYVSSFITGFILVIFTLGLYYPIWKASLYEEVVRGFGGIHRKGGSSSTRPPRSESSLFVS